MFHLLGEMVSRNCLQNAVQCGAFKFQMMSGAQTCIWCTLPCSSVKDPFCRMLNYVERRTAHYKIQPKHVS